MNTDRIYIAKDGKSGKHVLVRILAIDDIGANYPPVDSNAFNELMMARDAKSLVLAAQGLGPMFAAKDDLAGRIFIPGELQQGIVREMNLVPSDLGSLLSECYFDPYAEPTGTDGVGYREIGFTGEVVHSDRPPRYGAQCRYRHRRRSLTPRPSRPRTGTLGYARGLTP